MTQDKHIFSVTTRTLLGKKTKQLRRNGQIIGSVSIPNQPSLHIEASYRAFTDLIAKAGESGLLYLTVDVNKKQLPVLIEDLQIDPITEEILHVTFRQVSLTEKVEAEVPIIFIGEVAVKDGVLVTVKDSVEVEALPTDLPEHFEVDLSILSEIGQSITLADLVIDASKVELVLAEDQAAEDVTIVVLQGQQVEEEVVDEALAEPEILTASDKTEEVTPNSKDSKE